MINERGGSVLVNIKIKPSASVNRLELTGEDLILRISAPPVEGKANKAAIKFISEALQIPKSSISIDKGIQSRNKIFRIAGVDKSSFLDRIHNIMENERR